MEQDYNNWMVSLVVLEEEIEILEVEKKDHVYEILVVDIEVDEDIEVKVDIVVVAIIVLVDYVY